MFFILGLMAALTGYAQQPVRSGGDQGNGYFLNPVFAGEYPDPTILRDGNDYYMTHTSMNNFPGLLIWHSVDLVNWKPVAHALNRNIGEIWAPDLIRHKGRYYIYFPARDYNSTMVVSADRITGPWSDPVEMKISFIDPGHIVGEDGKRYLYFSDGNIVQLSDDGLSTVGPVRTVYEGWKYPSEWLTECFCLESPKLFRRGDYFYLISAQGGTTGPHTSHMAVVARSKSVFGPWENSPFNPLMHTYSYSEKWWSKGHASMVDTPEGEWWVVYHAFLNNFRTLGRMTLLEPIDWTPDGWPRIRQGSDPALPIRMPAVNGAPAVPQPETVKSFSAFDWHAFDGYEPGRYAFSPDRLIVKSKGTAAANSNPLLFTPGHPAYTADVKIDVKAGAHAGLLLFYSPVFYRGLEISADSIYYVTEKRSVALTARPAGLPVSVRLVNDHQTMALYYSPDGKKWVLARDASDISPYTGNLLGNFRSLKVALCTYGPGEAAFSGFRYVPEAIVAQ